MIGYVQKFINYHFHQLETSDAVDSNSSFWSWTLLLFINNSCCVWIFQTLHLHSIWYCDAFFLFQCLNATKSSSLVSPLLLLVFNKGCDGDASADGFFLSDTSDVDLICYLPLWCNIAFSQWIRVEKHVPLTFAYPTFSFLTIIFIGWLQHFQVGNLTIKNSSSIWGCLWTVCRWIFTTTSFGAVSWEYLFL